MSSLLRRAVRHVAGCEKCGAPSSELHLHALLDAERAAALPEGAQPNPSDLHYFWICQRCDARRDLTALERRHLLERGPNPRKVES